MTTTPGSIVSPPADRPSVPANPDRWITEPIKLTVPVCRTALTIAVAVTPKCLLTTALLMAVTMSWAIWSAVWSTPKVTGTRPAVTLLLLSNSKTTVVKPSLIEK